MNLYPVLLHAHSWLRWLVIGLAAAATVRAWRGARAGGAYARSDERLGLALIIAFDTQLLLGLLLYTEASGLVREAFRDVAFAMRTSQLRFWMLEHPFAMVIAAGVLHGGRVLMRRAPDEVAKNRRARWVYGAALLALIVGTPWPGLPYGRSLLR